MIGTGRWVFGVLLCVFACQDRAATPPPGSGSGSGSTANSAKPPPDPGTWYHARLSFEGIGDLPFFLHLLPTGQNGRAYVLNGEETAEFTAAWRGNGVTITGPWTYTSVIEAKLDVQTKSLEGSWTRDTPLWGAVVRDFVATPIAAPDPKTRFPPAGAVTTNVAGTWRFQFAEHEEGKGAFQQTPDGVVRGYIKPGQLGDIRYLAGNIGAGKLALSQFNGNSANLVVAEVSSDGMTMSGTMSMQNVWNEKFTAKKVEDFPFENKVHLKPGAERVSLLGLDKYKGKPTLAVIFATWCPSCNDAMPFLKQLYTTYHGQGLEALSVAYDLSEDEKANVTQLGAFRNKYAIPWQLLQVPSTVATWAKTMPKELDGWDGLPIVMLVRPDGTVQTVFGGWFGPATGAEGDKLYRWLEDQTKTLVAQAK